MPPLRRSEVAKLLAREADIVAEYMLWPIVLTHAMVVALAK